MNDKWGTGMPMTEGNRYAYDRRQPIYRSQPISRRKTLERARLFLGQSYILLLSDDIVIYFRCM